VLLFLLLVPAGCRKPEPKVYLFRYHFQPGELLRYDVSLQGEGEVTMVTSSSKKDPRNLVLPVRFQGNLLLEAKVDNVSPAGDAELVVSYKDFHLTVTNQVRDRVITITITDRLMRIMEGESVREEIAAGEDDFPLAGIGGEKFSVEIDRRGKIIKAQSPPLRRAHSHI